MDALQDPVVQKLAEENPGYRFWYGRQRDGSRGSLCATLVDQAAGIDPTIVANDEAHMRQRLEEERGRAERGDPRPSLAKLPVRVSKPASL